MRGEVGRSARGTVVEMADLFGEPAEPSAELMGALALLRHAHTEPPDWLLAAVLDRLDTADRLLRPPLGRFAAYAGGLAAGAAGALVIVNRARLRELMS